MRRLKYGEKQIKEAKLEVWDNPEKDRNYWIELEFPEFTCLCPRSGYPDFAVVKIKYIPDKYVVELKSLKLYLNKYRNLYISHEAATNKIYSDLYKLLKPRNLEVTLEFHPRGNMKAIVRVSSH